MVGAAPTVVAVRSAEDFQALKECQDASIDLRLSDYAGDGDELAAQARHRDAVACGPSSRPRRGTFGVPGVSSGPINLGICDGGFLLPPQVREGLSGKAGLRALVVRPPADLWPALEPVLAEALVSLQLTRFALLPERAVRVPDASGELFACLPRLAGSLADLELHLRPAEGSDHDYAWLASLTQLERLVLAPGQRGQWDYPELATPGLAAALGALPRLQRVTLSCFCLPEGSGVEAGGDAPDPAAALRSLAGLPSLRRVELRLGVLPPG